MSYQSYVHLYRNREVTDQREKTRHARRGALHTLEEQQPAHAKFKFQQRVTRRYRAYSDYRASDYRAHAARAYLCDREV